MKTIFALTLCLLSALAESAQAWNRTGHMVVAYIAYSNLDSKTRQRVDDLLQKHPDYLKWVERRTIQRAARGQAAFLNAAAWPDRIRDDPRFFDDNEPPKPPAYGFPDLGRHQMWHYRDLPFTMDGTPIPKRIVMPNALTQVALFLKSIGNPSVAESIQVYELPWLLHLVGDIHQPLHCVSRFTKTQRDAATGAFFGDQGGNLVYVDGERNLHAYWDQLLGGEENEGAVAALAMDLMNSLRKENPVKADPDEWTEESVRIAKEFAYSFGAGGSKEKPARLGVRYRAMATRLARKQAALAGYRLAATLRAVLGN